MNNLFSNRANGVQKHKAFTLAETLTTLGIIGVVAAMTIPNLVKDYQKKQYVTQLKKAYTQFNQVLNQVSTDQGCIGDLACTDIFGPSYTHVSFGDEISSRYNTSKVCRTTPEKGCFADSLKENGTTSSGNDEGYRFIDTSGVSYYMPFRDGINCNSDASITGSGPMTKLCATSMMIDVNGPSKGPNESGRDVFGFYITNGKGPMIYPVGGSDDDYNAPWNGHCQSPSNINFYCTGRVIEEGWEINY